MYFSSFKEINLENIEVNTNSKFLIFIGEGTPQSEVRSLFELLDKTGIEYFGGIFPGLIFKENYYKLGFIIKHIDNAEFVGLFPMDSTNVEIPVFSNKEISSLVIVDGLSSNIKNFLSHLFTNYTDTIKYFGGGAGSISPTEMLPLFHNGIFYENSAIVILLNSSVELIIEHGWEKMDGPFLVTSSQENILNEINWINSLDFYKEVIFEHTKLTINKDNFFDITKGFPLGIETEDENFIVRDLWSVVDENRIICVSDIPNNSVIYILKGDTLSLLESTRQIDLKTNKKNSFLFDCVSRALFLDDNFIVELSNISNQTSNEVFGVLSIGEVATTIKGKLEFLNKTLVYCEY